MLWPPRCPAIATVAPVWPSAAPRVPRGSANTLSLNSVKSVNRWPVEGQIDYSRVGNNRTHLGACSAQYRN